MRGHVKFYTGASMGYCEECHQTVKPTTLEAEEGFAIVCPICAAAVSEQATADLPEECTFQGCVRKPDAFCVECGDAMCTFHSNRGDVCDACMPVGSYSTNWSEMGYGN